MCSVPLILSHVADAVQPDGRPIISFVLFVSESFVGVLVYLEPGAVVPPHVHEHKDECFDVIEGQGVIVVDGHEVKGKPGTLVFVPAGTQHGLRNDSAARWLLRETVHERVYARTALYLVFRAFLKRLPVVGVRWRCTTAINGRYHAAVSTTALGTTVRPASCIKRMSSLYRSSGQCSG